MTNNNRRIQVWLFSRLYHPNFSGAAIQTQRILAQLVQRGFDATVLTTADHRARNLKGSVVSLDGVEVYYLPAMGQRPLLASAGTRRLQSRWRQLRVLLSNLSASLLGAWTMWRRGHRGDIVQIVSCNEFSFLITSLARARGMHPIVRMTLIGHDDPASIAQRGKAWRRTLKLAAFRQADAVVGLSTAQTSNARFADLNDSRVIRIPGGVNLDLYHPITASQRNSLCQTLGLDDEKRYIIFVGSAIHRKGIDVLVQAFIRVAREIEDVDLLIVGPHDFCDRTRHHPGQQELVAQLEQQLQEAGYASRVHWTDRVDNVHQYLQVSSIFCLPTRQEGFGHVTAEAMAVGLPVVIARLEGVTTDLVPTEEEGITITGHQPADYTRALVSILQSPDRAARMGNAARAHAVAEYDLEIVVQRYADLYQTLAGTTERIHIEV